MRLSIPIQPTEGIMKRISDLQNNIVKMHWNQVWLRCARTFTFTIYPDTIPEQQRKAGLEMGASICWKSQMNSGLWEDSQ